VEPLLNRSLPVKPNLVFNIDASGSMAYDCIYMPHVLRAYAVANPNATNIPGANTGCTYASPDNNEPNTIASTADLRHASPDNNTLIYDPRKRYDAGFDNNGVRLTPPAVPATFVRLDTYFLNPGINPANLTAAQQSTFNVNLVNYRLISVLTGGFCLNRVAGACTAALLTQTNPFGVKATSRTDCGASVCTLAEEKRNITNWRTYHNTRMNTAKVGVGTAFSQQTDTFRLTWMTIQDAAPVATIADYGFVSGTNSTKKSFYAWLNGLTPANGTPLRVALDNVGKYYKTTPNNGPWGNRPWQSTSTDYATPQLSCRRSYAILTTDGLWNDATPPTSVNGLDRDGVALPAIIGSSPKGSVTYTFTPGDKTEQRSIGKSDRASGAAGYTSTLADVAFYYWANDLRTDAAMPNNVPMNDNDKYDPFWQNMTTFTVSFGAGGSMTSAQVASAKLGGTDWSKVTANTPSTVDDLIHAAHNGGGDFLEVSDANTFAAKLKEAMAKITARKDSQAGVAASGPTLVAGSKKYVTGFVSGQWWGNISSVALTTLGGTITSAGNWQVVSTDATGNPVVPNVSTIPSYDSRTIVAWKDSTNKAVSFTWANVNVSGGLKASGTTTNSDIKLIDSMTQGMFNYLRGDRTDENGSGASLYRSRRAVLGDIAGSTPLLIRNVRDPGYSGLGLPGYVEYLKKKKDRTEGVVLVGANDGMLHAFRESDGVELWAYIPQIVLGKLHQLADINYTHQFFVDGPITEADAYFGTTEGWRNLAVAPLGLGGKAVYAVQLDSANPAASLDTSSVRWEINANATAFSELGHVLAPIQTGVMNDGRWVGIFGNGYQSASCRSSLFIVNLNDGSLIKKIDAETATGATSLCAGTSKNGLGGARLVFNADKKIIGAYAGDLQGNVWKFNLEGNASSNWIVGNAGKPLFTAKTSANVVQPITATPEVIKRIDIPLFNPSYMVVVGTGKLHENEDQSSTGQQAIYGLWDKKGFTSTTDESITGTANLVAAVTAAPTVSRTVAADITTTSAGLTTFYTSVPSRTIDWTVDRGWYLNMTIETGQKVLSPAEQIGQVIRVDSVVPSNPAPSCDQSKARAYSYFIEPLSGACKKQTTFDTNADGIIDDNDATACVMTLPADGVDAIFKVPGLWKQKPQDVIVSLQGVNRFETSRVDTCPTCGASPGGTPVTVKSRIWRQIFMP
jgi:type IV pilus assembly protein PilY1